MLMLVLRVLGFAKNKMELTPIFTILNKLILDLCIQQ